MELALNASPTLRCLPQVQKHMMKHSPYIACWRSIWWIQPNCSCNHARFSPADLHTAGEHLQIRMPDFQTTPSKKPTNFSAQQDVTPGEWHVLPEDQPSRRTCFSHSRALWTHGIHTHTLVAPKYAHLNSIDNRRNC